MMNRLQTQFKSMHIPESDGEDSGIVKFANTDPKKPKIRITDVFIHPSSDSFDPSKDYVGFITYLCGEKNDFTLNGVHCQTGDIFIKESNWIMENVQRRRKREKYLHGRLFFSVFGCWKKKKLAFVGAGFSYHERKWKYNSATFNTSNPNNNDDGYHNTDRKLHKFEEDLLKKVCRNLYTNHLWLESSPETRFTLKELELSGNFTCVRGVSFHGSMPIINEERRIHGKLIWIHYTWTYGFIACLGFNRDIFFHRSAVLDSQNDNQFIFLNDTVQFNLVETSEGWQAKSVRKIRWSPISDY